MNALRKFLILYPGQVTILWLFIEIIYLSENKLRHELGEYWWLIVFVLPFIVSISILYSTHKRKKLADRKWTFDNVEFLKNFKRKHNNEEIDYYHETKDNWAIAIFPPNLLKSSSADLNLPKAFFGFVKLIVYFTRLVPFWRKPKIPTPVYFAITNFRILYKHRFQEKSIVKTIWLKNIKHKSDIKLSTNEINGLPQVIDIKTEDRNYYKIYVGEDAGFKNDTESRMKIYNTLTENWMSIKPVSNHA